MDVRVIAATNTNLKDAVLNGKFRDDLYYRLNVINIHIPPLRMRREDIPLLAGSFIERLSPELRKMWQTSARMPSSCFLTTTGPAMLESWRMLSSGRLLPVKGKALTTEDLAFLHHNLQAETKAWTAPPNLTLYEVEKRVIDATLQRTQGNITKAAGLLGIDRSTLYDKLKKYKDRSN